MERNIGELRAKIAETLEQVESNVGKRLPRRGRKNNRFHSGNAAKSQALVRTLKYGPCGGPNPCANLCITAPRIPGHGNDVTCAKEVDILIHYPAGELYNPQEPKTCPDKKPLV